MAGSVQRTQRRQRREQTRDQILAAGTELLAEAPFRELTVDAVMARTEHSRTVFYRHFDDVGHLTLAIMGELGGEITEVSERFREIAIGGGPIAGEGLRAVVDLWVRRGRLLRGISEAAHHDAEIEAAYRAQLDGYVAMTTAALEALRADGRAAEPIDPPELARALVLMNERYLLESFGREPIADPDRVLATLISVWWRTTLKPS